jgi:hypothetical protein
MNGLGTEPAKRPRGNPAWAKGISGNPGGKFKVERAVDEGRELCRLNTARAIQVYIDGLSHPNKEIQITCADRILDRAWGKVVERKELAGPGGSALQVEVQDNTPTIRLLLEAALPPIIEGSSDEKSGNPPVGG